MTLVLQQWMIQNREHQDEMLHQELFNVNMRLYKNNEAYRKLVLSVIEYMRHLMNQPRFADYPALKGISGANIGVPFNIIGYYDEDKELQFMLNPEIINRSGKEIPVNSNCGSLMLNDPIEVIRDEFVTVRWCTLEGEECADRFNRREGGFTIQHEIEHNIGILITDHI